MALFLFAANKDYGTERILYKLLLHGLDWKALYAFCLRVRLLRIYVRKIIYPYSDSI